MKTFRITRGDQTLATITGENVRFGERVKPGRLDERDMVPDASLLKGVDADDKTLWLLTVTKNVTIEEERTA